MVHNSVTFYELPLSTKTVVGFFCFSFVPTILLHQIRFVLANLKLGSLSWYCKRVSNRNGQSVYSQWCKNAVKCENLVSILKGMCVKWTSVQTPWIRVCGVSSTGIQQKITTFICTSVLLSVYILKEIFWEILFYSEVRLICYFIFNI